MTEEFRVPMNVFRAFTKHEAWIFYVLANNPGRTSNELMNLVYFGRPRDCRNTFRVQLCRIKQKLPALGYVVEVVLPRPHRYTLRKVELNVGLAPRKAGDVQPPLGAHDEHHDYERTTPGSDLP